MSVRSPRQLLAVGTCVAATIAACMEDRAPSGAVVLGESQAPSQRDNHDHGKTAKVSQDLSSANFNGTSLALKTLSLTFDDGPGPRTKELSIYLKTQNIKATFFMNGARLAATGLPNPNGINPVADPAGTLAQVLADGHLVANHTTTHRNLTSEVPDGQRVQELSDTDTDITGFVSPSNHLLFRAPFGAYNGAVFNTLSVSAMNKYIGPIYWEAGGFSDQYPNAAADWACWQGSLYAGASKVNIAGAGNLGYATTVQCGDAYIKEIDSFGKGIVLMHDPYEWAQGSTVDMVKYIVPILVGKGYSFVRLDDVPAIAAALPCDPTCATCSGPAANQCTTCVGGRYKSGGQCLTCSTCSASQYEVSACSTAANRACGACNAACATCSGSSASQCTSCAANKYLSGGQCLACSTCAASEYQVSACNANANTSCGACDASCGTCSGPGATQCTSCAASKYLSGGACTACTVCGAGTYPSATCTSTTNTVCSACDAGCAVCFGPGPNQCGSCPPASFMNGGACSACKVCEAGSFQASACGGSANAVCAPCAAGSFSGTTGASSCSACPEGTTSGPGALACTACGSCDDGNACTQDRCDAAKGCVHDAVAGCGVDSGTSGGLRDDVEGGPGDPPSSESGCAVAGATGQPGGSPARGLLVLAALGLSRLARRRRPAA